LQKVEAFSYSVDNPANAVEWIKQREHKGFQYEEGDASLELLLRKMDPDYQQPFYVKELSVHSLSRDDESGLHHASVKVEVGERALWSAGEGRGPVEAMDVASKDALLKFWPELEHSHLTDYKVRILNPEAATGATTHVWIEASYRDQVWNTIGCSPSIIEASLQALCDTLEFFILKNCDAASPVKSKNIHSSNNTKGASHGDQAA
jgi:2-isopropylmalate synthase